MPSGGKRPGSGRPVTVGATEQLTIKLSPELLARVRALQREQHVTIAESVRWLLRVGVDSPGDLLAAMAADPTAEKTTFVERVAEPARRSTRASRPA